MYIPTNTLPSINKLYDLGLDLQEMEFLAGRNNILPPSPYLTAIVYKNNWRFSANGESITFVTLEKLKESLELSKDYNFLKTNNIDYPIFKLEVNSHFARNRGEELIIYKFYIKNTPSIAELEELELLQKTLSVVLFTSNHAVLTNTHKVFDSLTQLKEYIFDSLINPDSCFYLGNNPMVLGKNNRVTDSSAYYRDNDQHYSANKTGVNPEFDFLFKYYTTKYGAKLTEYVNNAQRLAYESYMGNEFRVEVIGKILEINNSRLFIKTRNYNRGYSSLNFVNLSSPDYNYIDVGRIILTSDIYNKYDLDATTTSESADFILTDIPVVVPNLSKYHGALEQFTKLAKRHLTNNDLSLIYKNLNSSVVNEKKAQEAREIINQKIYQKFKDLQVPGTSFKVNGISFKTEKIEYEEQQLSLTDTTTGTSNFIPISAQVFRRCVDTWKFENINFDRIFEEFLAYINRQIILTERSSRNPSELLEYSGTIGEIPVKIKREVTKSSNGSNIARYFINDIRINKDEIYLCLRRALCYTTSEEYVEFLSKVKDCSLKVTNIISEGINIKTLDLLTGEAVNFLIRIKRLKNANYIVTSVGDFKVKNTDKLLSLKSVQIGEIIGLLLNPEVVDKMTEDGIRSIIKEGQEYLKKLEEDSKNLLERTEKLFNLKKIANIRSNGKDYGPGYLVEGTNQNYAITTDNNNFVFSHPDSSYICMIDKGDLAANGITKLLNRIYALKNDKYITKFINTLE